MKIKMLLIGAASLLVFSTMSHAADTKKPITSWTCEDFIAVDENYRPTAVAIAEVLNKKGKVKDAVLDVDGIEKVTPLIIDACKKDTQSSFISQIEAKFKNLEKDLKKEM